VAIEVATILSWLASRAGADGRIADPIQMSARLLWRLCGDRRIVEADGKRHRATTLALVQLEQLGVITMASEYRVGKRGRLWSCWYQFGSGVLARQFALPKSEWDEIKPFTGKVVAPTLALVEERPVEMPVAPIVELRVLGERVTKEGLVRVLTDGVRGPARTLVTSAPDVERPTAAPSLHAPWFVRAWLQLPFTPARLWAPNAAMVIAFPDVEARRRMPRRLRIAWGGGGGSRGSSSDGGATESSSDGGSSESSSPAPLAPVIQLAPRTEMASSPIAALPAVAERADSAAAPVLSEQEMRAELAIEAGAEVAAAVPLDLLEVILRAYGGLRGRSRAP
jgi:hypothetical protein